MPPSAINFYTSELSGITHRQNFYATAPITYTLRPKTYAIAKFNNATAQSKTTLAPATITSVLFINALALTIYTFRQIVYTVGYFVNALPPRTITFAKNKAAVRPQETFLSFEKYFFGFF